VSTLKRWTPLAPSETARCLRAGCHAGLSLRPAIGPALIAALLPTRFGAYSRAIRPTAGWELRRAGRQRANAGAGGATLIQRAVAIMGADLHRQRRGWSSECAQCGSSQPSGEGCEQSPPCSRRPHRLRNLVELP
jgi:hypothetical protein